MATDPARTSPPRLGAYELRRVIGRGASGTVWEAWDPRLDRRAAIKVVRLTGKSEEERADVQARFRQEAQLTAQLQHRGIIGVFGYDETEDDAYLVMEFVDGETLFALLDRGEMLPLDRIVAVLSSALMTLDHCHRRGVVHRDIKPANLMLTRDGETKLADFGVARPEASELTVAGTLIGTLPYMSPEQFTARHPVDARSDIWSCGVVLYELLAGQRPFQGDLTTTMEQVLTHTPPPPSTIAPSVPLAFDAVVARALAKDPNERFANASAFAAALQAALPTVMRVPPGGVRPRRAVPWTLVAGGTALLVVGLGGAMWWLDQAPAPVPPAPRLASQDRPTPTTPMPPSPAIPPQQSTAEQPAPAVPSQAAEPAPAPRSPAETAPPEPVQVAPLPAPSPSEQVVITPTPPTTPRVEPSPREPAPVAAAPAEEVTPTVAPPAPPAPEPSPMQALPTPASPPPESSPATPPTPLTAPPVTAEATIAAARPVPFDLAQARTLTRELPCSMIDVREMSGRDGALRLSLSGLAPPGAALEELLQKLRRRDRETDNTTQTLEPVHCPTIAALAAVVQHDRAADAMRIVAPDAPATIGGHKALTAQHVRPGEFALDLYGPDGAVRHVLRRTVRPSSGGTTSGAAARENIEINAVISGSPGQHLLVAITTSAPLDRTPRPVTETASTYLPHLRGELDRMVSDAARKPETIPEVAITILPVVAAALPTPPTVRTPQSSAVAPAATTRPPRLNAVRCADIVARVQLGGALSDEERSALRTSCRP